MQVIGVPKEIKTGERRVALSPEGVKWLVKRGRKVIVETGAGVLSGFKDEAYVKSGALIVSTAHRVWKGASLIKKVKEPQESEFHFFQSKHTIFTFFHLASQENCPLVKALLSSGCTALAYETVVRDGEALILRTMSDMAGIWAAYFTGLFHHLAEVKDGRIHYHSWYLKALEQTIRDFPEPVHDRSPGKVLVLGGGHVGQRAAEMAVKMGGEVFITEIDPKKREYLSKQFQWKKLKIQILPAEQDWSAVLAEADAVIGAVYLAGKRAPVLVTEEMLKKASAVKKKVIVDVSIDQGGNIAGSHSTTYQDPAYADPFGNIRFAVANIPSLVGDQASRELERVTLDYTAALADDMDAAIIEYPELAGSLQVKAGKLLSPEVALAHQLHS